MEERRNIPRNPRRRSPLQINRRLQGQLLSWLLVLLSFGFLITGLVLKDKEFSDRDRIESLFVMGRATLNFIDLCGVHVAYFEDESFESEGMIKSIGFTKQEDGRWFVDLTDFFVEPCQHGHGLKKDEE